MASLRRSLRAGARRLLDRRDTRRDLRRPAESAEAAGLMIHIDTLAHFHDRAYVEGWVFHPGRRVVRAGYIFPDEPLRAMHSWGLPSPEVAELHGPEAASCRFGESLPQTDVHRAIGLQLSFTLDDGRRVVVDDLPERALRADPYHALQERFFAELVPAGAKVLEVGSRNRSGNVRRELLPQGATYVGADIAPGDNVDVVADAHSLSASFAPESFDAVISFSTFEHLAMPWKVALEINRVLKPGGVLLVTTHQAWPLHEQPWDFWRFSDTSWHSLFNSATGFEVVDAAMGERGSIVARVVHAVVAGHPKADCYLGSAVVCRKLGPARVAWDVALSDVIATHYPEPSSA